MPPDTKSILVIDDEKDACEMVKSFLEAREYTVHTALNGREGIEAVKNKKPSLVFLDVKMPGMSGLDVLAELKKENINVKVILLTGLAEGEQIDKAKELGISGVLTKPIQLAELSKLVKENI